MCVGPLSCGSPPAIIARSAELSCRFACWDKSGATHQADGSSRALTQDTAVPGCSLPSQSVRQAQGEEHSTKAVVVLCAAVWMPPEV